MQEKRVESIREVDFSGLKVPFVAVYGHPDDFQDKWQQCILFLDLRYTENSHTSFWRY